MPAETQELHAAYRQRSAQLAQSRPSLSGPAFALNEGPSTSLPDRAEGDLLVSYRAIARTAEARISNMVFGDEMPGRIYPGAMLWAGPLVRSGRLEPVYAMVRSDPLVVTVDGVVMKEGSPESYTVDGTESGAAAVVAKVVAGIATSQARIEVQRSDLVDSKAALLEVGLSASGWGANIAASLRNDRQSTRSSSLNSISQCYFTLTCA